MLYINEHTKLTPEEFLNPYFPEAAWNVSALFQHDDIIFDLVKIMNNFLGCHNPIYSVHGCFPVKWNSGRITGRPKGIKEIEEIFLTYKKLGINVYLTFSNHLIDKDDLTDKTCNYLLDMVADLGEGNGVIVSSDLLSDYIRESYPGLSQVSSILKVTIDNGKGNAAYYKELEKHYDRVVIHLDDNLNLDLLGQLDPRKIEILVNEPCIMNCPVRDKHYNVISTVAKDVYNIFEYDSINNHINTLCQAKPLIKQVSAQQKRRNCVLTFRELEGIYHLDIVHFKLQGRDEKKVSFLYDLIRYLFEPDYIAPLLFKYMVAER